MRLVLVDISESPMQYYYALAWPKTLLSNCYISAYIKAQRLCIKTVPSYI